MKKKLWKSIFKFFLESLLFIVLLVLVSCKQEGELLACLPPSGYVTESIGGPPVAGAVIAITGTQHSTVTDNNGFFQFAHMPPGLYDLTVTKAGRAGSRLMQVYMYANSPAAIIVQPLYSYDSQAVTPPAITITGIERDKQYYGIIPITVNAQAGSCPVVATEFHQSLYLKIGTTTMNYYDVANSGENTLTFQWNTSLFPPGRINIKAVAYDNNNNRCELDLPVYIKKGTGNAPDVAPLEDYYIIIATTYGESMVIYRADPGSRAPVNSTILVEFTVQEFYNGIVIYKSPAETGEYRMVGQTTDPDSGYYKFIDYAPDLEPGATVFYKLAFFNQCGIGPQTAPIPVRILPKYNLSLVSPANNTFITDSTPTISWTCGLIPDAQRTDWVIVKNLLDTTFVAYSFLINETQFTLPELLYNNKYEWDVRSYYEYVNSTGNANVLSRSFPRGRGSSDFSLNGAFYFTLIKQE